MPLNLDWLAVCCNGRVQVGYTPTSVGCIGFCFCLKASLGLAKSLMSRTRNLVGQLALIISSFTSLSHSCYLFQDVVWLLTLYAIATNEGWDWKCECSLCLTVVFVFFQFIIKPCLFTASWKLPTFQLRSSSVWAIITVSSVNIKIWMRQLSSSTPPWNPTIAFLTTLPRKTVNNHGPGIRGTPVLDSVLPQVLLSNSPPPLHRPCSLCTVTLWILVACPSLQILLNLPTSLLSTLCHMSYTFSISKNAANIFFSFSWQ